MGCNRTKVGVDKEHKQPLRTANRLKEKKGNIIEVIWALNLKFHIRWQAMAAKAFLRGLDRGLLAQPHREVHNRANEGDQTTIRQLAVATDKAISSIDLGMQAKTSATMAIYGREPTLRANGGFCITSGSSSPGALTTSGISATPWVLRKLKSLPKNAMIDNRKVAGLTRRHNACVGTPKPKITFYQPSSF